MTSHEWYDIYTSAFEVIGVTIFIVAMLLTISVKIRRAWRAFMGPSSHVDDTLSEMFPEKEYAGTRNAKQQSRRGHRHG